MAAKDRSLLYALLLIAAIAGFGYLAVGKVALLFSVTFIGGLILWPMTVYRVDIDPHSIITPYLATVMLFICHVYEEYTAHIEVALGSIMQLTFSQKDFLTVAAFVAPVTWLVGAWMILKGWRFGYFIVSTFLFGMMFGELSHFAFPFLQNGTFHYVAGMYTCIFPIAAAWYTFFILLREVKRQGMHFVSQRSNAGQPNAPSWSIAGDERRAATLRNADRGLSESS
ncbi:MAG: hypothetical protein ACREPQ_16695 [Rhodanobacter sp.]